MRISVGIDIAKQVHWVTAIDADGWFISTGSWTTRLPPSPP